MPFQQFSFHPKVVAGITALGYTTPTPIQAQAIPKIMAGHDIMGLAQTGTGKTAAFALPILHRLMQGPRKQVRALVIAPTRELAEQINDAMLELGQATRLKSITVYGGVNVNPQIERLRNGVEIVVACPGRLLDHINQGTIDLTNLELLVLDEADQMFDMGFLPDIRRILKHLPAQRQTMLFSATMPTEIRGLAREILRDPATVQVDHVAPAATVSHALYPVAQHLKTGLLMQLLKHTDTDSVLIFTRTKHRAKRVGEQLEKAGYTAASLQGNLSQNRRQAAMDGFRNGTYQILVATDIAARGIDVSQVSHVINYDIPDTSEAYIHRIGRTGRAARNGDAFTMITDEDTVMVKAIERTLGTAIERRTVDGFDYTVAAPRKDDEFARPPRPPRNQPKAKKPAPKPAAGQGTAPVRNEHKPASKPAGAGGARPQQRPQRPR
ncbi:MAG: DEAD/DEAH box helicase [Trichlorobacter sp.]|uniref:DEAD/DEAH box helicase n=1 Tax=Trichlorobacter sp. TaxID=2911007 RepID=UPI002560F728|nr:DEAD/DEAH box helicase [Trichlorobacter sp.]MDK9716809.1 DEAD/DEAH box helicase [Trichlorobacter sp.]